MKSMRTKVIAVVLLGVAVAAALGSGLGLATARVLSNPLVPGMNLVGGPLNSDVPPADYIACLPSNSWRGVYIFDAQTQSWRHYFNTAKGIPAYVNRTDLGGISVVPRLAGVFILMDQQVDSPRLKDSPSESCN